MTFKKHFTTGILHKGIFVLFFLASLLQVKAQELNAEVNITFDKVKATATNPRIFETLETAVREFLNNTKWTNDEFSIEERIECSFLINIDKINSPTSFEASIQVSSNRPVYNSDYSTSLLNYRDGDFAFEYTENAPIIFTPDQFRNNLSSVVAYYAYIVLALDYDSFSIEGGKPYFTLAQRVVANAQTSGKKGWSSSDGSKNRFWLVDNALQETFDPLRKCFYEYHRLGLDKMYTSEEEGREAMVKALEGLMEVHRVNPLSFNMRLWFLAKYQEIINMFEPAPQEIKERVLNAVNTLDPANINKYQKIKN